MIVPIGGKNKMMNKFLSFLFVLAIVSFLFNESDAMPTRVIDDIRNHFDVLSDESQFTYMADLMEQINAAAQKHFQRASSDQPIDKQDG